VLKRALRGSDLGLRDVCMCVCVREGGRCQRLKLCCS
jgi:hypothetical protein